MGHHSQTCCLAGGERIRDAGPWGSVLTQHWLAGSSNSNTAIMRPVTWPRQIDRSEGVQDASCSRPRGTRCPADLANSTPLDKQFFKICQYASGDVRLYSKFFIFDSVDPHAPHSGQQTGYHPWLDPASEPSIFNYSRPNVCSSFRHLAEHTSLGPACIIGMPDLLSSRPD